jgi:hypothetical protein
VLVIGKYISVRLYRDYYYHFGDYRERYGNSRLTLKLYYHYSLYTMLCRGDAIAVDNRQFFIFK